MRNVNYCYLGINILSYSVVFIKKINLLRLRHWWFSGKFMNFSEAVTGGVLWKKLFLKDFAIFTGKLQACNFIEKKVHRRCFPLNIAKFLKHLVFRTSANGCCWFFKAATEQRWASASELTLNLGNSLTVYEQLIYQQFNRDLLICVWFILHKKFDQEDFLRKKSIHVKEKVCLRFKLFKNF